MKLNAHLVKAFTRNKDEGNPAGVLLDAENLSDNHMISIAAELGFSESAFVQKSTAADFKVRFFTAKEEVSLCGHATIAAFHTLFQMGRITLDETTCITLTQESKAGILPVTVHADGLIVMTQTQPVFDTSSATSTATANPKRADEIANLLGITKAALVPDLPIQAVSTGSPKLMIPIQTRKLLFAIKPNFEGIASYCQKHEIKGFYPFTPETILEDSDFHARQFNPLAGIDEDPITGVAAGALGAYALKHHLLQKSTCIIEQGYIMHKPGRMYVEMSNEVKVGGYAVSFGTRDIVI